MRLLAFSTTLAPAAMLLAGVAGVATAQQRAPRTPAPADKQICKRSAETGSIIPRRKECHTRAEWDRLAADNRANAQSDADRRMGATPSGL